MIGALATLLSLQLAGEILVRLLALPLPGPVLGMILLFAVLALRGTAPRTLEDAANGLLRHLSLLFVPAGVGIVVHLDRVAQAWLPLLVTVIASTALTILVTAFTLLGMQRLTGRRESP